MRQVWRSEPVMPWHCDAEEPPAEEELVDEPEIAPLGLPAEPVLLPAASPPVEPPPAAPAELPALPPLEPPALPPLPPLPPPCAHDAPAMATIAAATAALRTFVIMISSPGD